MCSLKVMAPKVVCATCSADSWFVCDAESLGLRMAQVTPSTAIRECPDGVCAEDSRRCWFVLIVESGRTVSRMAERNCGGAAGREKRRSTMRDHRAAFQEMRLKK